VVLVNLQTLECTSITFDGVVAGAPTAVEGEEDGMDTMQDETA
jgi:hypothetical protein